MKRSVILALTGLTIAVVVGVRRARAARLGSLRTLDDQFHDAYDRQRTAAARSAPVLVLVGETLTLFDADRRSEYVATAPDTQLIKAAAHVPVGIFAMLSQLAARQAPIDAVTAQRLVEMRCAHLASHDAVRGLDASAGADVEAVLRASDDFLQQILAQGRTQPGELSEFAAQQGPLLLRLTEHATRLELDALHGAVETALHTLDPQDRSKLEVIVAGAHQARARSLGLQYFQKRLGEAPGEEKRVAYAEAAVDASQARELVGTRRLDRTIARAFFGDQKRLQRDVLGDAAARQLAQAQLERMA